MKLVDRYFVLRQLRGLPLAFAADLGRCATLISFGSSIDARDTKSHQPTRDSRKVFAVCPACVLGLRSFGTYTARSYSIMLLNFSDSRQPDALSVSLFPIRETRCWRIVHSYFDKSNRGSSITHEELFEEYKVANSRNAFETLSV